MMRNIHLINPMGTILNLHDMNLSVIMHGYSELKILRFKVFL